MLTKTVVLAGLGALAHACTDTLLWSELPQGRTLSSRTMDFGIDLGASIWKIPRGMNMSSLAIEKCPECTPHTWQAKYGAVAMDTVRQRIVSDGMNEKGLSAASLVLKAASYPDPDVNDKTRPMIAAHSLASFFLTMCATVAEAKELLKEIQTPKGFHPFMLLQAAKDIPIHVVLHDAEGNSAVIEFVGNSTNSPICLGPDYTGPGKACFYDNNGYHTVTNDPALEVHQLRVTDMVAQFPGDWHKLFLNDLNGNYRPPSRFDRMYFFNKMGKENEGKWLQSPPSPLTAIDQILKAMLPADQVYVVAREAANAAAAAGTTRGPHAAYDAFVATVVKAGGGAKAQPAVDAAFAKITAAVPVDTLGGVMQILGNIDDFMLRHIMSGEARFINPDVERDAVNKAMYMVHSNTYPAGSQDVDFGSLGCTLFNVVRDHKNLKYYYRTPGNYDYIMLDLNKMDFSKTSTQTDVNVNFQFPMHDLTHVVDSIGYDGLESNQTVVMTATPPAATAAPAPAEAATACPECKCGISGMAAGGMIILAITTVVGSVGGYFMGKRQSKKAAFGESTAGLSTSY